MLLSTLATSVTRAPPPSAVAFCTCDFVGHTVFSSPSDSSFHVCSPCASVACGLLLMMFRYFFRMCVVPDWSRRTRRVNGVVATHPLPDTVSPSSLISLQLLMSPFQIASSVTLLRTRRPGAALLVAVQLAGRWTMIATAAWSTGTDWIED